MRFLASAFLLPGLAILLTGCPGPGPTAGTQHGWLPETLHGWPLEVSVLPLADTSLNFRPPGTHQLEMEWTDLSGTGSPEDPLRCTLVLTNRQQAPWEGNIRVSLRTERDSARFFLPGFMYGTNQGDRPFHPGLIKQFPRLKKGPVKPPCSPFWYMRSDQLTHPVATMFTGGTFYGISGNPFDRLEDSTVMYHGFYCSMDSGSAIGFTSGYLEAPGIYVSPWDYEPFTGSGKRGIRIGPGSELNIPLSLYRFDASGEYLLGEILRTVYRDFHQPPQTPTGAKEALEKITRAISEDAYDPGQNTYALISKQPGEGRSDKADGGGLRYAPGNLPGDPYDFYLEGLIGWTNGTVIAVPLLEAAHRTGKPDLREQALRVIHEIVRSSSGSPTGLPYCTKLDGEWTNRGWWTPWVESEGTEPAHSSYILGQTLYYILRAYELEREIAGTIHREWLDFSERVLSMMVSTRDAAGAFPRFWSETDGKGTQYDAFSGCWVAAAMALHERITGKATFAEASRRAEARYVKDVQRMECIYTPLDVADAPDSEGILAYIRLTRILHEITGDEGFLDNLQMGLDYSFSYKFCYNVPVTGPPLDRTGWQSSGGDITSVCNAVVHCMSNSILGEVRYAWEITGDPYYMDRLLDTYLWGMQAFNREAGEFFFGKEGWSTEYFCQSNRYVLDIRLVDGSRSNIWFAYHPWATASILEGILDYQP